MTLGQELKSVARIIFIASTTKIRDRALRTRGVEPDYVELISFEIKIVGGQFRFREPENRVLVGAKRILTSERPIVSTVEKDFTAITERDAFYVFKRIGTFVGIRRVEIADSPVSVRLLGEAEVKYGAQIASGIETFPAIKNIIARVSEEQIVSTLSIDPVVAQRAIEHVVIVSAIDDIIGRLSGSWGRTSAIWRTRVGRWITLSWIVLWSGRILITRPITVPVIRWHLTLSPSWRLRQRLPPQAGDHLEILSGNLIYLNHR